MQVLLPDSMQLIIQTKRDMDAEDMDDAPSTPRQSCGGGSGSSGGRPAGLYSPRTERLAPLFSRERAHEHGRHETRLSDGSVVVLQD